MKTVETFQSSFRALKKKKKKTGSFAFPRINQNAEEFMFSVLNLSKKVLSAVGGTGTSKMLASHSAELELLVSWGNRACVIPNTFYTAQGFSDPCVLVKSSKSVSLHDCGCCFLSSFMSSYLNALRLTRYYETFHGTLFEECSAIVLNVFFTWDVNSFFTQGAKSYCAFYISLVPQNCFSHWVISIIGKLVLIRWK